MPPGVPGAPWDWRFGLLNVGGGALAFGGGAFFEGFGGGGVAFFAFAAGLAPPNENAGFLAGAGAGAAFDLAANGFAKAGFFAAGAGAAFLPFGGATTFLMPFVDAATAFFAGALAFVDAAGFGLLKKLKPWQPMAARRRMAMVRIIFRVTCDGMIR